MNIVYIFNDTVRIKDMYTKEVGILLDTL